MNNSFYHFARGWLIFDANLSVGDFNIPKCYKSIYLNGYYNLFYDPEIPINFARHDDCQFLLIGSAYYLHSEDASLPVFCNETLRLFMEKLDLAENKKLLSRLDDLGGRFACLFFWGNKLIALNDLFGMRQIYYHEKYSILSSHYDLINNYSHDEKSKFDYFLIKQEYVDKKLAPPWNLPGNLTPYKNIKLLLPNHFIALPGHDLTRFFPREEFKPQDAFSAAAGIGDSLRLLLRKIALEHNLLLGLTAGFDSRITLSACRQILPSVTCYTWHQGSRNLPRYLTEDQDNSLALASRICREEGISHRVIDIDNYQLSANEHAIVDSARYNIVDKEVAKALPDIIKAPAIRVISFGSEIIRKSYFNIPLNRPLSEIATVLAWDSLYHKNTPVFEQVVKYYLGWLEEFDILHTNFYGLEYGEIFMIEHRFAQFFHSVCMGSDSFIETVTPICCRNMVWRGLAVSREIRNRNKLAELIIEHNWPELIHNYSWPNRNPDIRTCFDPNVDLVAGAVTFNYDSKGKYSFKIMGGGDTEFQALSNRECILETNTDSLIFGFADNFLHKGDYIDLNFDFALWKNQYYYLSFTTTTLWHAYSTDSNILLRIMANGKLLSSVNTNNFSKPNNHIYIFNSENHPCFSLKINLLVNDDCRILLHNSFVKVNNFVFRREFYFRSKSPWYKSDYEHLIAAIETR